MDTQIRFLLTVDSAGGVASVQKLTGSFVDLEKQTTKTTTTANTASQSFMQSLGGLKTIAASVGLTFGALELASRIRQGAEAAMDFNREWTKVSVILRDTPAAEVEAFRAQIMALPPALGSATENAAAFYQVLSSGFTQPAEAMMILEKAAIAAAGGFTTTETAVRAGTAVLNAYGMTVDKTQGIFDVMAKTVDLGVVTFEELSTQLGAVIPIAAATGVSFKEISAATAALTLSGQSAGQAITGIRSTITSIISPSEKAVEVAARLGISWDAQALKARGLQGMMEMLRKNTKVTAEDISILTGRVEATNAVMALTSEQGADKLTKSFVALDDASKGAGASAEALAKAQQSLSFQVKALGNEASNAAAEFGKTLEPALIAVIQVVRESITGINGITVAVGAFAVALAGMGIIGAVTAGVKSLSAAMATLSVFQGIKTMGDFRAGLALVGESAGITAASLGTLGTAAAVAAAAFIGWQLGRLIGEMTGLDGVMESLFKKLNLFGIDNGMEQFEKTLTKMAESLKTKFNVEVPRAGMSLEQWKLALDDATMKAIDFVPAQAKVNIILAEMSGKPVSSMVEAAKAASKQYEEMKKLAGITKEQLAQGLEVVNKKWNDYKQAIDPANKATTASKEEQEKAARAAEALAKKVQELSLKYGDSTTKLLDEIRTIKEDTLVLEKNRASKTVMVGVQNALGQATLKLIAAQTKHPELLKKIDTLTADVNAEFKGLNLTAGLTEKQFEQLQKTTGLTTETFRQLANFVTGDLDPALRRNISTIDTGVAALERLGMMAKPTIDGFAKLEGAMKDLGITSDNELARMVGTTKAAYEQVMASATTSLRERELATAAYYQAEIDLARKTGGVVSQEQVKAVEAIKGKYGELSGESKKTFEQISRQVSTIFTDMSKGIVDSLMKWKGFGASMLNVAKEMGTGMLRLLLETLFQPLEKLMVKVAQGLVGLFSGKGFSFGGFNLKDIFSFDGITDSLTSALKKGVTQFAGLPLLPGVAAKLGLTGGAALAGSSAFAFGGIPIASAGMGGALPGSIMAGFGGGLGGTAGGTAGAAGAAGAGGASFLGSMGALMTNPWTIGIAGAVIAGTFAYQRLTRRGREKETATGPAEELSAKVWNEIIPAVEAGSMTIAEGIEEVQKAWTVYTDFLHANLKDQTVIARSIETQRVSLTEGLQALENIRLEREVAPLRELAGGFADMAAALATIKPPAEDMFAVFMETGRITDELKSKIQEFGGDLGAFENYSKASQLQARFAGLAAQFRETGVLTAELAGIMRDAGVDMRYFAINLDQLNRLKEAQVAVNDLSAAIQKMLPPVRSAVETFVDLNEITPELAQQIQNFGGDLALLEEFQGIRQLVQDFESLAQTVMETGEGAAALIPIFESVGASTDILNKIGDIGPLKEALEGFGAIKADLMKLFPETEKFDPFAQFMKQGIISPELKALVEAQGGSIKPFQEFAAASGQVRAFESGSKTFSGLDAITDDFSNFVKSFQGAAGDLGRSLLAGGANPQEILKQMGESVKASQAAAAKSLVDQIIVLETTIQDKITELQEALKLALEDVRDRLNEKFTEVGGQVVAMLGTIDQSLASDITRLAGRIDEALNRTNEVLIGQMQTSATLLINAIGFVEKAIQAQIAATTGGGAGGTIPGTEPDTSGGGLGYEDPNYVPTTSPETRARRMATGGEGTVWEPTLFMAGEAGPEDYSFEPRSEQNLQTAPTTIIQLEPHFHNVQNPFEEEEMLERLMDRFSRRSN